MAQPQHVRSSPAYVSLGDPEREIRLFILYQGSGSDELHGELLNVSLAETQQARQGSFEALSYAWGDVNDTVQIACRMSSTSVPSPVSITKNLHAALKQFRRPTEPRLLWCDALCINQLDISERNSQVKHMAEIYSAARRVLVWLGENQGDNNPFQAVDLYIEEMGNKQYSNVWSGFQNPPSELVMEALPLFARPWFRRKWIIQEVLLARDVVMHCGSFEYSFNSFQLFGWYGSTYNAFRPTQAIYIDTPDFQRMVHAATGLSNMLLIGQLRRKAIERSLGNLLMETRQFECSDPRDYVYSLLSIATDVVKDGGPSLQVDYSLSLEDVVSNTTRWMVEQNGLDVLSQATGDDWSASFGQTSLRSSWSAGGLLQAVNCSRDDLVNPLTTVFKNHLVRKWGDFSPPPSKAEHPRFCEPNMLHTLGKPIDEVGVLSSNTNRAEPWTQQPFSLTDYRAVESTYIRMRLKQWWELVQPVERNVNDVAAAEEAGERPREFGRLIFCGELVKYQSLGTQVPDYRNLLYNYEVYLHHWMSNPSPPLWGAHVAADQLMEELDRTVRTMVITREYCITKRGRLALVPPTARVGDVIFLLNNAQSPYLLRPLPNHEYAMIGEVYVSDPMIQQMKDELPRDGKDVIVR